MTSSLPHRVFAFIRAEDVIQPQERILVAVSGGPDSTALLHLLHRWSARRPFSLAVAHFDHGLRGEASRADAAWVEELAAGLGLACHRGSGDVRRHQRQSKLSLQTAARELRHRFLRDLQAQHGYHQIALGHTADDQLELFLLRLLRGAGPTGLTGMRPRERGLIRPLLKSRKAEILAWLAAAGLTYRQDASNLDRRYRRNQIRLDLIPHLLSYNPRLAAGVARLQASLQEQEDYLAQEAQRAFTALQGAGKRAGAGLSRTGLLDLHPALQKRVLMLACAAAGVPLASLGQRHLKAMIYLAQRTQGGGAVSLPGAWHVQRSGEHLLWLPATPWAVTKSGEMLLLPPEAGTCTWGEWTLTWETLARPSGAISFPQDPGTVWLDADRLQLPLRLRGWQPGDRLQPLGMAGSKKVQDIFVDAKIPRWQRPGVPVLCSGEQIIWLVGLRLAEPGKITMHSRRILQIRAQRSSG